MNDLNKGNEGKGILGGIVTPPPKEDFLVISRHFLVIKCYLVSLVREGREVESGEREVRRQLERLRDVKEERKERPE